MCKKHPRMSVIIRPALSRLVEAVPRHFVAPPMFLGTSSLDLLHPRKRISNQRPQGRGIAEICIRLSEEKLICSAGLNVSFA